MSVDQTAARPPHDAIDAVAGDFQGAGRTVGGRDCIGGRQRVGIERRIG